MPDVFEDGQELRNKSRPWKTLEKGQPLRCHEDWKRVERKDEERRQSQCCGKMSPGYKCWKHTICVCVQLPRQLKSSADYILAKVSAAWKTLRFPIWKKCENQERGATSLGLSSVQPKWSLIEAPHGPQIGTGWVGGRLSESDRGRNGTHPCSFYASSTNCRRSLVSVESSRPSRDS